MKQGLHLTLSTALSKPLLSLTTVGAVRDPGAPARQERCSPAPPMTLLALDWVGGACDSPSGGVD